MNKKYVVLSVVAALVACMSGSASAALYQFSDSIDHWSYDLWADEWHASYTETFLTVDAARISEGNPLSYTHDLNRVVGAGDTIVGAYLELDFTNDEAEGDDVGSWWIFEWDDEEYATVAYNGSDWVAVEDGAELDDGVYSIVLDIDWLDDDGMLDVTVAVRNNLGAADAWLDHSRVYGTAEVVPVPGAVLLGMLGLSAAGLRLRKRA